MSRPDRLTWRQWRRLLWALVGAWAALATWFDPAALEREMARLEAALSAGKATSPSPEMQGP